MKHLVATISSVTLAALVSACASAPAPTTAAPGAPSETMSGVSAQKDAAARVNVTTITATVEAIDLPSRIVGLVGPEGNALVVQVGDEVRNLDQVKVGDRVRVEYFEGLLAELLPPGSDPRAVALTDAVARAAPGERPAGGMGEAVSARVVIEFVDTLRNVVHFTGPKGKKRVIRVEKPEFRAMLRTLKPGDVVELTYFEAVAVKVEPAGN
ncbi:MAG: hypothetical protein MUE59_06365 [Thiobacillaceae bacterium]|jgi:hypothetical protein|nr:hypothetical protein [Thiobacillaceae bacterium]